VFTEAAPNTHINVEARWLLLLLFFLSQQEEKNEAKSIYLFGYHYFPCLTKSRAEKGRKNVFLNTAVVEQAAAGCDELKVSKPAFGPFVVVGPLWAHTA
jgi:hypothetical protein